MRAVGSTGRDYRRRLGDRTPVLDVPGAIGGPGAEAVGRAPRRGGELAGRICRVGAEILPGATVNLELHIEGNDATTRLLIETGPGDDKLVVKGKLRQRLNRGTGGNGVNGGRRLG
jgi:hypothetical protein